jgi:hypothetical protein
MLTLIALILWFAIGLYWLIRFMLRENTPGFFVSIAFLALGVLVFMPTK